MTIQLDLAPHQPKFVDAEVRSGRFRNQAEVLSLAIDRMAERDEARKLAELRETIQISRDESEREEGIEVDPIEMLARIRKES